MKTTDFQHLREFFWPIHPLNITRESRRQLAIAGYDDKWFANYVHGYFVRWLAMAALCLLLSILISLNILLLSIQGEILFLGLSILSCLVAFFFWFKFYKAKKYL